MSVISMFVAPVAGRLADKIGGKWILFVGLSLFSLGMGILIASSHLNTTRWHLLPGLLVAGVGMGLTFAPLQTVAMLNVEPRMAGAASGFINTTRQLGGVIGFAAVGALLQAQLSDKLHAAAVAQTAGLPEAQRQQFVSRFGESTGKLDVGNTAGGINFPPGTPPQAAKLATSIFHEGYTNAMRITLWLPIAVLAVGALSVLLVSQKRRRRTETASAESAPTVAVGG
jgi:MFS family permease